MASFFFRFLHIAVGDNRSRGAAITANSDARREPDDVRRRACSSGGTASSRRRRQRVVGGGEACSGVHVGGHATVANAAVIPRGFVGRQSVTDLLRRRSGRFAGVACSSTHATATRSALYRHNGARQHHSVGRSLCSVQAAGVHGETTRSLDHTKHRHT